MAIYMKFDKFQGDVTEEGHTKWIEVNSFQFGVGRGVDTPVGAAENRTASQASISEITVTKQLDTSTGPMFQNVCSEEAGQTVQIDFTTSSNPPAIFLTYILTNTLLSGWSISCGGDRPTESVSLNFTKVEVNVFPLGADNAEQGPFKGAYDLALAKWA